MQLIQWSRSLIPFAALLVVMLLRALEPAFVLDLQLRIFDGFQRLHSRSYEQAPVRIVDIDDTSLERIGQWPWPRTQIAQLIDRLSDLGAAVIAFDIVFAEPDRTSPEQILPLWGRNASTPSLRAIAAKLPDHDAVLARSIERAPVVTGFVLTYAERGRAPARKYGFAHAGQDPLGLLSPYTGAVPNLASLEQAAAGNGSFSIERDRDGVIRRVPLLYRMNDTLYPSLAAESLRVALGGSTYAVRSADASGELSFGGATGITAVRIAPELTVPTDRQGRVWVHFSKHQSERYLPAWKVLDGTAAASQIEGHIVFVGTSAAGLSDLRATPLDPQMPGVEVHAQLVEQILLGHYLARPDWATGAELAFTFFWGLLLVLMIRRSGALWGAAVGCIGVVGAFVSSWYLFRSLHTVFDPVFPSLAGVSVYFTGSLVNYLHTERERSRIRGAFSRYLSPPLVRALAAQPERLRLGGETREMTVLFADIRGFTSFSEQFDAEDLTRLINAFLTPMTDVILLRSGTIDKYMGDCIMSFWNAPLDDADHARNACHAALEMITTLNPLNQRLGKEAAASGRPHVPLRIGIGINTGNCCVGNLGSEQRFDYSVVGDEVNLASRLEGQSKEYGVPIVIGENTRVRAPGFASVELDLIRVKGRMQPVQVHALLGDEELRETPEFRELFRLHSQMLEAYRAQKWDQARAQIEECATLDFGLEGLYALYRSRIDAYQADPPVRSWDGVYTARSK